MKLIALLNLALLGACVEVKYRGEPGLGSPCDTDSECSPFAGVCAVEESQTCVQCTVGKAEACGGATPVCGDDFACRACSAHADCASDACLPDGACATEDQVLHVKQGGSTSPAGMCTKEAPCGALEVALLHASSARRYVRVTGVIESVKATLSNKTVTLLGGAGAALRGLQSNMDNDEAVLSLLAGSKVELYDLELRDARATGIRIAGGSSLRLERSKVVGALGQGVDIVNGTATLAQAELSDCGSTGGPGAFGPAVALTAGELTVTRSKILNSGVGIYVSDGQKFSITHSIIAGHKTLGGLYAKKPGAGSKLEFNTIADNKTIATAAGYAGGVTCDDGSFTFAGNIVFRNTGGAGGFLQQSGACKLTGSFVGSSSQAETGSLGFVDAAGRDYHLTAGSPATVRDVAGVSCGGLLDLDGEPRDADGGCDLGADEYQP